MLMHEDADPCATGGRTFMGGCCYYVLVLAYSFEDSERGCHEQMVEVMAWGTCVRY